MLLLLGWAIGPRTAARALMGGKFTEGYNRFANGRHAWMFQASDEAGMNFTTLLAVPPRRGQKMKMGGDSWISSPTSRKRIQEEFQPGDFMFLYQAEPQEAVVGLARLASRGYAQRQQGRPEGKGTFFDLDWWMLMTPLRRTAFEADPMLKAMEKSRFRMGSISRVSETEARRLLAIIALNEEQRIQVEREWRLAVTSSGLPIPPSPPSNEGGREADPELRSVIEEYSMFLAQEHYNSLGYDVENTASTQPFDLRCRKGKEEVRVEVKGTRSDGSAVELTAAEVNNARGTGWRTELFIVTKITVKSSDTGLVADGGEWRRFESWNPRDEDLSPTRYRYTLPR
ncbi:DUF3883 domain-containing protein [Corallococcus sp. AB050B]|nr:DUF3883 domain-containing protein [Corallococcus sp. AB050B]